MDKTLEIAAWLYKNNKEFTNLKTAEAQLLMDGTMAMAHIFLLANGQGDALPGPLYAGKGRVFLPELEGKWYSLANIECSFSDELLHYLKIILRRFSYAPAPELMAGLIKADPFCYYAKGEPVAVKDDEIPEGFLKSMRLIKHQFADFDFDYKVIKVNDRNFFAGSDFELLPGEYDEIVRAMKEGLIEPNQLYRIDRNKAGGLMVW
ncbi:MAG: hypothetical protein IJC24_01735 [Clostridia bacterium]|nr:hypothetical protein [Clostridia bacterium]